MLYSNSACVGESSLQINTCEAVKINTTTGGRLADRLKYMYFSAHAHTRKKYILQCLNLFLLSKEQKYMF